MNQSIEQQMEAARTDLLYGNARSSNPMVFVSCVLIAALLKNSLSEAFLTGWLSFMTLGVATRIALVIWRRRSAEAAEAKTWAARYGVATAWLGVGWALMVAAPMHDVWTDVARIAVVIGVIALAVPVLVSHVGIMFVYTLPVVAGAIFVLFIAADREHHILAILILLFGMLLLRAGVNFHRQFLTSLRLGFENEALAADLSRQRDAVEALNRDLEGHRANLENEVAKRTSELKQAKEAAEVANVAKSAFLNNMSHEMRTPLHQIGGLAQLLRVDPMTPRQADRMGKLDDAVRRMSGLVETILELTRIEANRVVLEDGPVVLDELLSSVTAALHDKAEAKGLVIKTEAEHVPDGLHGDPNHIKAALLHYTDNAVRFTETGSVTIRVKPVTEDGMGVLLRFEVEDTGIGIEPDVLPRLFNIFEQADNSSTRKYGGAGIGLAMTKKLAQLMGGDAGCESQFGQGSTFWFSVRLKKPAGTG